MTIPDDFLIMAYAPQQSQVYIERSLSDQILSVSREYSPAVDADTMILYSKSYCLNVSGRKESVFVTYSITSSRKMAEWVRTVESKHNVFDVDLVTLSRNGLCLQKLPETTLANRPNPFIDIYNRCSAKVYSLIVSEDQLASDKMKEMVLSRIYDKKIRGWKNHNVLSRIVRPETNSDKKCPICLEQFQADSLLFNSGKCTHVFHLNCMDKLIITDLIKNNVTKCPCCRVALPVKML